MAKRTYTQSLQERRERLTKMGMWSTFVAFRERLKKAGVSPKLAADYSDLACSPTATFPLTPDRMDVAVACALAAFEPHSPAWAIAMSTGRLPDLSSVNASESRAGQGAAGPDSGAQPGSPAASMPAADGATGADSHPSPRPASAVALPNWRHVSGTGASPTETADLGAAPYPDSVLTGPNVDPGYARLIHAAAGKRATQRAEIIWVNEVLLLRLDKIDPDTVPSQGAVALLEWVRQSAPNRSAFMTALYAKTIQTRLQAETESDEVGHDGRTVEELLESFERQLGPVLRPRPQDAA